MSGVLFAVSVAQINGARLQASRSQAVLGAINLSPEAIRGLVIAAIGVVALTLVLLVVYMLMRGRVRRRKPIGPQAPMEAPELYDLRTVDVDDDIRFCVEMARQVGGPVLELGAGTGRITLSLARTGLIVTGLETSRLMLQRAKMKAEQLSSKLHVEWVEGDITNFSLGGRKFRLILAPFNVLQELRDITDLENCLRRVAEHLEPDGKFVAIVQPPRWDALKVERRYLKTSHNPRTGELINFYQSLEVDPIWQKLRGSYEYEIWDQTGRLREVIAPFEGSYLTCPEMALLLRAARMQLDTVYGSFAREPLTLKSRQMIFIARPLPMALQPAQPQPAAQPVQQPAPAQVPVAAGAASAPAPAPSKATKPASAAAAKLDPAATARLPESLGAAAGTSVAAKPPASPASGGANAADASQAQGLQKPPAQPPSRRTNGGRRTKPDY